MVVSDGRDPGSGALAATGRRERRLGRGAALPRPSRDAENTGPGEEGPSRAAARELPRTRPQGYPSGGERESERCRMQPVSRGPRSAPRSRTRRAPEPDLTLYSPRAADPSARRRAGRGQ